MQLIETAAWIGARAQSEVGIEVATQQLQSLAAHTFVINLTAALRGPAHSIA